MSAGRCVSLRAQDAKASSLTSSSLASSGIAFVAEAVNGLLTPSNIQASGAAEVQLEVKGQLTLIPKRKAQVPQKEHLLMLKPAKVQYEVAPQVPQQAAFIAAPQQQMPLPQKQTFASSVFVPVAAAFVNAPQTQRVATRQVRNDNKQAFVYYDSAVVPQVMAEPYIVNVNHFVTVGGELDTSGLFNTIRHQAATHGGLQNMRLTGAVEVLKALKPHLEGDWAARFLAKYDGLNAKALLGDEQEIYDHLIKMLQRGAIDISKEPVLDDASADRFIALREMIHEKAQAPKAAAAVQPAAAAAPVQAAMNPWVAALKKSNKQSQSSYSSNSGSSYSS